MATKKKAARQKAGLAADAKWRTMMDKKIKELEVAAKKKAATKKKAAKRTPSLQETKEWFYAQPSIRELETKKAAKKKPTKK